MVKNNLPKIRDMAYVISLGEYKSIGTHSTGFHVNCDNVTNFDLNIWILLLSWIYSKKKKKNKKTLDNKYITGNIYRKHANGSKIWQ